MISRIKVIILTAFLMVWVLSCATAPKLSPIDQNSAASGSAVTMRGGQIKLLGTPISVGMPLPSVKLVDAMTMKDVDLSQEKGSVLLLSIVVSVDTPVCEAQTHYLVDQGNILPKEVRRITISRDTPFAMKRFAEEAKLTDIQYLSDYKDGGFGRATGILLENNMLLARSVIIVDKKGIVRYIQIVPEVTHYPDMDKAFQVAMDLAKQP